MKANELMLGDLIKTNSHSWNDETLENKYCRVEMVGHNFLRCSLIDNQEKQPYGEGNSFSPIPLTPEILERNGFKYDGMTYWKLKGKDGLFIKVCPVQPNNDDWWHPSITGFEVNNRISDILMEGVEQVYVHQLQHAMRLCGIEKEIIL